MKWIRTWPAVIPDGRSYVVDQLPRVTMDNWDYRPVLDGLDDDTVIAEWDIAISAEDIERFTMACQAQPATVHVAPYKLYPASTGLDTTVWAHRNADGTWISDGEHCDLFSFGLVYLPLATVRRHLAETSGAVSDATFSQWHRDSGVGYVPVEWDVHLIHLHY